MKNVKTLRGKLPLPSRLINLMQRGRWQHPGDEVMMAKVPFIRDPLVFIGTKYREVCPTFDDFVNLLGLKAEDDEA